MHQAGLRAGAGPSFESRALAAGAQAREPFARSLDTHTQNGLTYLKLRAYVEGAGLGRGRGAVTRAIPDFGAGVCN